jgi:flagellar biosynthesis protein FlhA
MNALLGGPGVDALLKTLGPLRRMVPGGDVGLALCVLFQLSILILPIPTFLLDMALALSFIASILILLISISLNGHSISPACRRCCC